MIILNYLILINKKYGLDRNYVPKNLEVVTNRKADKPDLILKLEKKTHKYFKKMIKAAKKEGFDLICDSGYRSFAYQEKLYLKHLNNNQDTTYLALPGHSEHQTGLAVDIAAYQDNHYVDDVSKLVKEFNWLYANAHKFGFILRYPKCKEKITGYPYEPWHYRFVGKYAKIIMQKNITLEEFLDVIKDGRNKNSKNG